MYSKKHLGRRNSGRFSIGPVHRGAVLAALVLTGTLGMVSSVYANDALDVIRKENITESDWQIKKPVYVQDSTITTERVVFENQTCLSDNTGASGNTDWMIYNNQVAPFQLDHNTSLTADRGIEISNIQVGEENPLSLLSTSAFALTGASLFAPVIEVHNISSATGNTNPFFAGLYTDGNTTDTYNGGKTIDNTIRADEIRIHDISSDTVRKLTGAYMGAVDWQPFTAGGTNNILIENIRNTATQDFVNPYTQEAMGTLVYGLSNSILGAANANDPTDPSTNYSIPFTVSGNTTIRNIYAAHGSAIGTLVENASSIDNTNNIVHFHNLNISDIHGSDMSIGLYGGTAKVEVDNANINMTGKNNEYAGLSTASVPDFAMDTVKEFAVAGPFIANIYMDNADGIYTINGNVLADQGNHVLQAEYMYNLYKAYAEEQLNQPGLSDEEKKMIRQEIQQQLQPYEEALEQEKEHPTGFIYLGGHLTLYGDVYAKNGGKLNMHLTEGSIFEGQADSYTDFDSAGALTPRKVDISSSLNDTAFGKENNWPAYEDEMYKTYGVPRLTEGTINITMDPGSTWITRGKSFITSLDFNGGGLVDTRKGHGVSVNIEKLTGHGGTFLMDFSKDAAKSDMLYIKDLSEAGTQHIQAYLLPGTTPDELKGMRFATTGGDDYKRSADKFTISLYKNQGLNDVTLSVKNEKFDPSAVAENEKFNGGKNSVGTYKPGNDYVTAVFSGKTFTHLVPDQLKIIKAENSGITVTDDQGNYLPEYMKEETIDNPINDGTNWYIDAAILSPNDSAKIIKKSAHLDYTDAVYGIYTDTLNKRLGEARYSKDGDGLWARIRHDHLGRENTFTAKNTMTELGYDWKREETSFGKHITGAAVDIMNGDADYEGVNGSSDIKRYGAWFYDTRLGKKGHYTDAVIKYGRIFNKYNLLLNEGGRADSNYHNNYYSMSFEYGRKKPFASSWYIEPQAQVQYTYLSSKNYQTSQGARVHLAGTDSLISRLGFRLGHDWKNEVTFYVNGDFYHEFFGNQDILAKDMTGIFRTTDRNRGSWYEAGAGVSARFGNNTYGFIQADKAFGPKIEHTWSIEGGVNFAF